MNNKITIDGHTLFFKVTPCIDGGWDISKTIFYKETERMFFGLIKSPVILFTIQCNPLSPNQNKEVMAKHIRECLAIIEKQNARLEEIKNGQYL